MTTPAPIQTTDLDCAAYLVAKGHVPQSIQKAGGEFSVFTFSADAAVNQAHYYDGASVVAKDFAAALRQLKRQMFRGKSTINEVTSDDRRTAR